MARPGVTEQEVFEAIAALQEIGAKITVEGIRAELGHGSPNTINRHLRAWRAKPVANINPQSLIEVKQLKKHCAALEVTLEHQRKQSQNLSQALLMRDKTILQLEQRLSDLTQELAQNKQALEKNAAVVEAIVLERKTLIQTLTEAQRQQVEQFREDLKAVNEMSLEKVRDIGIKAQDRWLEEKVKMRDLRLEIERLKNLNKSLEERLQQEQNANIPLRKKIAEQQKLIAHCLDPKKVEVFNQQAGIER
jgi:colicin import membrane protein